MMEAEVDALAFLEGKKSSCHKYGEKKPL